MYLMNTYHEPHCMYCKNVWDYKFIYEVMSKAFIKRLQLQQQELFFKREIAMLPQTQKYIEYDQYINDLEYIVNTNTNTIYDINIRITFIEKELQLKCCPNITCTASYIFYKDRYCYKCKQKICALCRSSKDINHICNISRKTMFENYKQDIKEKLDLHKCTEELKFKIQKWRQRYEMDTVPGNSYDHQIVCVCPSENCKGFITNSKHQCSLCETIICVYCHSRYYEGHICNKNDIKTVDAIKKTTKACPKCATLIQKIDGCNQMWCTNCNTAFNWNNGKIDLGNIHNPHYFEWFRKMEINANNDDNEKTYNCEGMPNQRYFLTHISLVIRRFDFETFKTLSLYFRIVNHINDVIINRQVITNDFFKNLDLRLLWVKNKINENKMKMILFRRNKREKINHIKNEIFDMYVMVSIDICHKIMVCNDHNKMIYFLTEWNNLIKYTNQCFEKLQLIFRLQMPYIKIKNDTFLIESQHNYLD